MDMNELKQLAQAIGKVPEHFETVIEEIFMVN